MAVITYQNQPLNQQVTPEIFQKLFSNNQLVERGAVTVETGIKNERVLRKYDPSIIFKNPAAKFLANNPSETLDGRTLKMVKMEVHQEFSFDDAWKYINDPAIDRGSFADYENPAIMDAIVEGNMKLVNKQMYKLDILGKSSDLTAFTFSDAYLGLLPTLIADTNTVSFKIAPVFNITGISVAAQTTITHGANENANLKVGDFVTIQDNVGGMVQIRGLSGTVVSRPSSTTTVLSINTTGFTAYTSGGTAISINQSNVIEVLNNFMLAVPDAILDNGGMFYVSSRVAKLYKAATAALQGQVPQGDKSLDLLDIPIMPMTDWLPNCIVCAIPANIRLGFDDQSDENNIALKWMGDTTSNLLYELRISLKRGIQYVRSEEITVLKPSIA